MMALILYLAVGALYLFYKWMTKNYNFFKDRGIAFAKPIFLFGTNSNMLINKKSLPEVINKRYNDFYDEKLVGLFEMRSPLLMVKDPAIIKQLAVKEFDSFLDHTVILSEESDPLFGKALFSLRGQKWRDMRATLSPAFTGSKMRLMFDFVTKCAQQSTEHLEQQIKATGNKDYEMREIFSKFTVDVIATCAFGLEVNSFANPDNDFQNVAKNATNFNKPSVIFKVIGMMIFPALMKALKVRVMDKKTCDFFQETIVDTIAYREKNGIIRHDMINLLMQAQKGKLKHVAEEDEKADDGFATVKESSMGTASVTKVWTDEEIAAQAFVFFLAGYDTTATTLGFGAYEIAVNPDVQEKLLQEIDEMRETLGDKTISYDQLQKLKYMDQVICEVLRRWPAAAVTDRTCVKDYELKFDDKSYKFTPGMRFWIPIYGLHHDPQYFPNPTKFDPERFSEENKDSINMDAYLPFGVGPRNCIGSRFALMELKAVFFYLLSSFTFEVTEKTQIPLQYLKSPVMIRAEKGVWIGLKSRK